MYVAVHQMGRRFSVSADPLQGFLPKTPVKIVREGKETDTEVVFFFDSPEDAIALGKRIVEEAEAAQAKVDAYFNARHDRSLAEIHESA